MRIWSGNFIGCGATRERERQRETPYKKQPKWISYRSIGTFNFCIWHIVKSKAFCFCRFVIRVIADMPYNHIYICLVHILALLQWWINDADLITLAFRLQGDISSTNKLHTHTYTKTQIIIVDLHGFGRKKTQYTCDIYLHMHYNKRDQIIQEFEYKPQSSITMNVFNGKPWLCFTLDSVFIFYIKFSYSHKNDI